MAYGSLYQRLNTGIGKLWSEWEELCKKHNILRFANWLFVENFIASVLFIALAVWGCLLMLAHDVIPPWMKVLFFTVASVAIFGVLRMLNPLGVISQAKNGSKAKHMITLLIVGLVGGSIGAALAIAIYLIPSKLETTAVNAVPQSSPTQSQAVTPSSVPESIAQATGNIAAPPPPASSNVPVPVADQRMAGISIGVRLRINHLPEERRKYLFDFGKINGPRLSIYISSADIFTVVCLDAEGNPRAIEVPMGSQGLIGGEFIYVSCEAGITGESSLLRVLVNGNEIRSLRLPYRIDIGELDLNNGIVGADLNGRNGSAVDWGDILFWSNTLTANDQKNMAQFMSDRPITAYFQSKGNQWMKFSDASKQSPSNLNK